MPWDVWHQKYMLHACVVYIGPLLSICLLCFFCMQGCTCCLFLFKQLSWHGFGFSLSLSRRAWTVRTTCRGEGIFVILVCVEL